MYRVITMCIIFLCATSSLADQWVDPHNMNTNAKAKYVKPILKKSQSTSSLADEPPTDIPFRLCSTNLRRIIMVLLNSAHLDKRDEKLYKGHIQFNIEPQDYDFLLNFGKDGDLSLEQLRKLDGVFSDSFKRSYVDEYRHRMEDFAVKLYSIVVNIQTLWMLGAFYLLYVVYQLFRNDFSLTFIAKYLLILVLIVDFGFRYHHLLQETEEHNTKVVYSKQCDTEVMSWTDWTKHLFSSLECEKKVVTPLDVFLYQIKCIIIIPMQAIGTGLGGFGSNMFTNLPWGLNLILWPLMLIFTLILFLISITLCTGKNIEFNFFHMIKMRFGGENILPAIIPSQSSIEQSVNSEPHRPMVQNIHIRVSPSKTEQENIPKSVNERVESIGTAESEERQEPLKTLHTSPPNISKETTDKGTNTAYVRLSNSDDAEVEDCFASEEEEENVSNSAASDTVTDVPSTQHVKSEVKARLEICDMKMR